MALQHERKLVFVASPTWMGWFCERCCWHISLNKEVTPARPFPEVQSRFAEHDCEEFAKQNWASSEYQQGK